MHIPDGFIDAKTAVVTASLATTGLVLALRQIRNDLPPRKVPLLGLAAAFVFAAQMVNFPVFGGTSGHLVGGTLIAVLLGLPAAVIVMTSVLVAQCFLFADGGVTALGANLFNMAVIAPVVGLAAYRLSTRLIAGEHGRITGALFAGWCSTVAAALACAAELAWSGTIAWKAALPAMTGIHMLIGVGEGLISALILRTVTRARPELACDTPAAGPALAANSGARGLLPQGLLVCVGIALLLAPFACPWPDGLEAVAEKLGFAHAAQAPAAAPMADYHFAGIDSPALATALAGVIGTLLVFGLALLAGGILTRRSGTTHSAPTP